MKELLVKILFAIPVYQSVILSIFLFLGSTRQFSYSKVLMGVFQLLMAIYFTFNFLYSIRAFELVGAIYILILPAILMFIPVFYLYMLSITTPGFRFDKQKLIHFIPAFVIVCLNIPFLFSSQAEKLDFISHGYSMLNSSRLFSYLLIVYMIGIFVVFSLQLIFYSIHAFKLFRHHKIFIENRYSFTENINLDWILALIICFIIFFVFNDILYLVGFRQHFATQVIYNVSMLVTTLYIGYRGLLQIDLNEKSIQPGSEYLNQQMDEKGSGAFSLPASPELLKEANTEFEKDIQKNEPEFIKKYSGSALTPDQKNLLAIKLQELMIHDKIFINERLSIEDVAIKLDTNSKYISQIINETYNKNFYNFINSFRIDEAKKLLVSQENEKYSILGIAQSVGFVSKSTFNAAFKRFTGLTPTEFKNINVLKSKIV